MSGLSAVQEQYQLTEMIVDNFEASDWLIRLFTLLVDQ